MYSEQKLTKQIKRKTMKCLNSLTDCVCIVREKEERVRNCTTKSLNSLTDCVCIVSVISRENNSNM